MAEQKARAADEADAEGEKVGKKSRRISAAGWIVITIVGVVSLHVVGAMGLAVWGGRGNRDAGSEVDLGAFQFAAADTSGSPIAGARFRIHIGLLSEVGPIAQALLDRHKFKVQQSIEELLRRASPADFEDPTLTELKRLLQETINRTLGKRVISEVIITNLSIERIATPEESIRDNPSDIAAEDPAWEELAPN